MALTKSHIIDAIQIKTGFTRKKSIEIFEQLMNIMKGSVRKGDDILVSGFGKFCIRHKKTRLGRNPATGEKLMLSPRKVVTFKCSGKLRKKLNN